METLYFIDQILCVISIFALGFFCLIVPKTRIAKYFYFLFGITILPLGVDSVMDGKPWYQFIWFFLFSLVAIGMGILFAWLGGSVDKETQKEIDSAFGQTAKDSARRNIWKHIGRM